MFCLLTGSKTNLAIQCYHAQENSELCQECPGQTHHYQCGESRCCQLGCHPGEKLRGRPLHLYIYPTRSVNIW